MLHVTHVQFNNYNITNFDFMGYDVNKDTASCHHLLVPKRIGGSKASKNVVVLNHDTSHPYIHIIELRDYKLFFRITRAMMEENRLGRLDYDLISDIHDCLAEFEIKHAGDVNINGEPIIREEYTKRLSLDTIKSKL